MIANIKNILLLLALTATTLPVNAQTTDGDSDGDLDSEEIEVVGAYRPMLADAVKISLQAGLPEPGQDSVTPRVYSVPIQISQVPYETPRLKPVALGKPILEPLDNIYAKAGFGTQFSPLLQAHYSSGRSDKYNYGFNLNYLSMNGTRENQKFVRAGAGLFGKYFAGPVLFAVDAGLSSHQFHYYGYDILDTTFEAEQVRERFLYGDLGLEIRNKEENDFGLDYRMAFNFQSAADLSKNKEIHPSLTVDLTKKLFEDHSAGLLIRYDQLQYNGGYERGRGIFRFKPNYQIDEVDWGIYGGLEFATDTGRFYLLPDVRFHRNLIGDQVVFFAGWEWEILLNGLRSMSQVNPFIQDDIFFQNSRQEDRYFGFRGGFEKQFGYQIRGSQKLVDDMPYFLNDTTDAKRFYVVYDKATILGLHTEFSWEQGELYGFHLGLDFRKYTSTGDQEQPWHKPLVTWNLGGHLSLSEQLNVTASLLGYGQSWAQDANQDATQIRGTVDVNLGATYAYNRYFTIFLDARNLASIKHQRWYNYPSFGAQVMGGLIFSL